MTPKLYYNNFVLKKHKILKHYNFDVYIWFTLDNDDTAESKRSVDWLLDGGSIVLPNPE